jgi:hypothetical protein
LNEALAHLSANCFLSQDVIVDLKCYITGFILCGNRQVMTKMIEGSASCDYLHTKAIQCLCTLAFTHCCHLLSSGASAAILLVVDEKVQYHDDETDE